MSLYISPARARRGWWSEQQKDEGKEKRIEDKEMHKHTRLIKFISLHIIKPHKITNTPEAEAAAAGAVGAASAAGTARAFFLTVKMMTKQSCLGSMIYFLHIYGTIRG